MQATYCYTPPTISLKKPTPRKLNRDKKCFIIVRICAVLKIGDPTYFAFEAVCRHGIRRALINQGWPWEQADRQALEIISTALNILGAERPDWYQGQPAWTEPGALPIKRERCKRCASTIPEDHWVFCSRECASFYHEQKSRERITSDRIAMHEVEKLAS